MPKTEQKTTSRWDPGSKKYVSETEGRDADPTGALAVQQGMSKPLGDIAKQKPAAPPPGVQSPLAAAAERNKKRSATAAGDALAGSKRGGY